MRHLTGPLALLAFFGLMGLFVAPAVGQEEEEEEAEPCMMEMSFAADSLGATPGGAQDIGWFREAVESGDVPHPNTFTPEGLLSEHDLPLATGERCNELLCVTGQAIEARLLVQPDVRYLAQLGFASNLKPQTFKRKTLNLVAVVDTSGSMGGEPLETVRESLVEVLHQLGPGDQMSIVRYSDRVEVVLPPTPAIRRATIKRAISRLVSSGSTAMEAGLTLGYSVARTSAKEFQGTTRVMLFTDERPNVGNTEKEGFMGMAKQGSLEGIGLTTIGVGTHFGAELATQISSVRGGNLFFFPDARKMSSVFEDEFDMMVTELAYDMELLVSAKRGFKIAGVYGIPGEMLEWRDNGDLYLKVSTIFLSKKKGAIFVAFSSDTRLGLPENKLPIGKTAGSISLDYDTVSGDHKRDNVSLKVVRPGRASSGLTRGLLLVNQVTSLKKATAAHHEQNDQETAYQTVRALASLYRSSFDPELATERELVFKLEQTLAEMSGHHGETGVSAQNINRVTGLPIHSSGNLKIAE